MSLNPFSDLPFEYLYEDPIDASPYFPSPENQSIWYTPWNYNFWTYTWFFLVSDDNCYIYTQWLEE